MRRFPRADERHAAAVVVDLRGDFMEDEGGEVFRREAIKGNSPAIQGVLETVRKVAASEASVLLRGESGTGKELLARAIHENSPRSDGPLVSVHCASQSLVSANKMAADAEAGSSRPATPKIKSVNRNHHRTQSCDSEQGRVLALTLPAPVKEAFWLRGLFMLPGPSILCPLRVIMSGNS